MLDGSLPMSILMALVGAALGLLLFLGKGSRRGIFAALTVYALLLAFIGFGALSNIAIVHKALTIILALVSLAACRVYFGREERLYLPARIAVCVCVLLLYLDVFIF